MTPEQITKWACEAGIGDWAVGIFAEAKNDALQAFATLVRNAALEEAAVKCADMSQAVRNRTLNVNGEPMWSKTSEAMDECAKEIRSMKS